MKASLQAEHLLQQRIADIRAERDRVRRELLSMGWRVLPSQTNFLWIACPERAQEFAELYAKKHVIVRCYPDEGVRITVGGRIANDTLLDSAKMLAKWLSMEAVFCASTLLCAGTRAPG